MGGVVLHDGRVLKTHGVGSCVGEFCVIHNPSAHPLNAAPLNWRGDRGVMERVCVHGVGHVDPDDVAFRVAMGEDPEYAGVHGCDGCCL